MLICVCLCRSTDIKVEAQRKFFLNLETKYLHFTPVSFFFNRPHIKFTIFTCFKKKISFTSVKPGQFNRRLKAHQEHACSFVVSASPLLALHPGLPRLWQGLRLLCITIPWINSVAFILERRKTWKYIFRSVLIARNPHKSFCQLFPLPLTLRWQFYRYTVSALSGVWLYWGVELSTFFLSSFVMEKLHWSNA